jgi:hypothetical protein
MPLMQRAGLSAGAVRNSKSFGSEICWRSGRVTAAKMREEIRRTFLHNQILSAGDDWLSMELRV